MPISRREFLKSLPAISGSGHLAVMASWPTWMPRLSFAPLNQAPRGDVLVVIFLRGAADALNLVVPFADDTYYRLRPSLGIPRPDDSSVSDRQRAIDLDGFFGLHPSLGALLPAWQDGHLAIVHACGAPDESRSHFKAMDLMERGVETESGPASGWISRHLSSLDTGNPSPLRAVGLGKLPQRSLTGAVPVTTLRSISDFHYQNDSRQVMFMQTALSALYAGDEPLNIIGQETLGILENLQNLDPENYQPGTVLPYPETEFGLGLKQIAMLLKSSTGLEIGAIDLGSWDTHFAQGSSTGQMANLARELADGLAAFYADLIDYANQLTIVVMTEFGRRAHENGSLGTDHGHGGLMILLGGNVDGGKVHTDWPGLGPGQLVGPGDLAVTTDYRDILAEVCKVRLNNPSLDHIFPGYSPTFHGLVKAT